MVDKIGIDGDYDMLISNVTTANTGDPQSYLSQYWKTNVNGDNPQNGSGYSNTSVDADLNTLTTAFNTEERRQLIINIQQTLMNTAASLFLGYPKTNMVSSKAITGVKMMPADYYWITTDIKPANE